MESAKKISSQTECGQNAGKNEKRRADEYKNADKYKNAGEYESAYERKNAKTKNAGENVTRGKNEKSAARVATIERENNKSSKISLIFSAIFAVILSAATVWLVFSVTACFKTGYIYKYRSAIACILTLAAVAAGALAVYYGLLCNGLGYRACVLSLGFAAIILIFVKLLFISGLWDKIDSVASLRALIASYGKYAVPAFLLMQILQVVVLPIPGVVAIGVGVAMFGAFKGAVYSFIGITAGSFIGFFIGRSFGYKVASWLVGKSSLDKTLQAVKGKDKALLTAMFLLPFFPDDVLCFVAGLSSMSKTYFSVMIVVTRLISTFCAAYSLDGKIIPYDNWWGIALWGVLILSTLLATRFIYKNGEKIERRIKDLCKLKKKE